MEGHFSDLQRLLKNGQKSDSFAAHFVQHFNTTTSHTDLRKYMTPKVVKQLNPISVTVMNNNSDIYGACRHKTTFHRIFLSTDDPVLNG